MHRLGQSREVVKKLDYTGSPTDDIRQSDSQYPGLPSAATTLFQGRLIGATRHYVTADLDEGPIIEQEVERVDHTHSPDELAVVGSKLEAVVLNRGIKWHAERRVFRNSGKTVVLK